MQLRIILDDSLSLSYTALQQKPPKFLQKTRRIGTGRKELSWNSEHQNPESSFPEPQESTEPGTRQTQSRDELKEICKIMLLCPALLLALTEYKVQNRILNKTHWFNVNHYIKTYFHGKIQTLKRDNGISIRLATFLLYALE